VPGLIEGCDLGSRLVTGALSEEDIVGCIRVEGRVELDGVDRGVVHVLTQDIELVAEVELAAPGITPCRHMNQRFRLMAEL